MFESTYLVFESTYLVVIRGTYLIVIEGLTIACLGVYSAALGPRHL